MCHAEQTETICGGDLLRLLKLASYKEGLTCTPMQASRSNMYTLSVPCTSKDCCSLHFAVCRSQISLQGQPKRHSKAALYRSLPSLEGG